MKNYILIIVLSLFSVLSCNNDISKKQSEADFIFDKINYYNYPLSQNDAPIKYRLSYNYDNLKPYRWLELDSTGKVMIDYIYEYDENWIQTGAKYREDGEAEFDIEVVTFKNDSTRVTEWLDSIGNVYYTMVDDLNKFNKTYRATFIGNKTHGYDSTFYTEEGFEKRIFFTNVNGKVYNDRFFDYDSVNKNKDWVVRRKIMNDTIREFQKRELYYQLNAIPVSGKFYEGYISTAEWSENVFNFTKDNTFMFFTRTTNWINQTPYLSELKNGIYTQPRQITELGAIYNGAISPSGEQIIFCTREDEVLTIYLATKEDNQWTKFIDLSKSSGINGGYFHWINESNLCFQSEDNNGDLVIAELNDNKLKIVNKLEKLNTLNATEFSPYIAPNQSYLLFTRYLEGDKNNQGFFISNNEGTSKNPKWSTPRKIDNLPYGWNASLGPFGKNFMYTNGDDILVLPISELNLN
ncbi:hypothetical protein [Winogradskyella poriferorum]|uniref:hypothetical protein n=1 Tax=Winogradskyella poriferorum TaxID=307627 RepID=UPI003D64BCBD